MQVASALVVLVTIVVVARSASGQSAASAAAYQTKYDNINLDQILNNDKILKTYVKCVLDKSPCQTADAKYLRMVIPDAIQTGCEKCSEKQRAGVEKTIQFIIKNRPDDWKQLKAKYDSDGVFVTKYEDFARNLGISV